MSQEESCPQNVTPNDIEGSDNQHSQSSKGVSSKVLGKRKGIEKRSKAWNYFEIDGDNKKAKCKHCGKVYSGDSKINGTSNLLSHINRCPKNPDLGNAQDSAQCLINFKPTADSGNATSLANWKFDQDASRRLLAKMIICEEKPFSFVEGELFKEFVLSLNPKFRVPSRFTARRDCMDLYNEEKANLKKFLLSSVRSVCLTTDTWTSLTRDSYLCLTAHFIDDDWKLHKKILNFCLVSSHKGRDLGLLIEQCLHDWGIERVFAITVDNASNNDTAIKYLREQFCGWEGDMSDYDYLHFRCAAHIVNLVVQDGLKHISPSIARVRAAVKYVKATSHRLKMFKECVEKEKLGSKASLCLDVATRWNSTFLMLNAAFKLRKAFTRYETIERQYKFDLLNKDGTDDPVGPPNSSDWDNIEMMLPFLEHFYDLTLKISGSTYVTATSFFTEISYLSCFLKEWIEKDDIEISPMASRMLEKFEKYWGDFEKINFLIYVAEIMDPGKRLEFVLFTIGSMYDGEKGREIQNKIKDQLFRLYNQYERKYGGLYLDSGKERSDSSDASTLVSAGPKGSAKLLSNFMKYKNATNSGRRSDLDKYISENSEPCDDHLLWWKLNSPRFPVLSLLARDVLAIPISTVASESAFSTGGRILDSFRTSLSPSALEALICTQDWFRKPICTSEEELSLDILKIE